MVWNNSGCPIWEVSVEKKLTLCPVGGGSGIQQRFTRVGSVSRTNPLTLIYHFWRKRCHFRKPPLKKGYIVRKWYKLAASLESPDNQRACKIVVDCMQDKGFNRLASNKIKLSVNEIKWSSFVARTRAISLWILDFGPEKITGGFEKWAPGTRVREPLLRKSFETEKSSCYYKLNGLMN